MAPQAFPALLAEKVTRYRSSFEQACSGLFGGGASVVMEYEDDDEDGAVPSPSARPDEPLLVGDLENDPTVADPPDTALVRSELDSALTRIAEDFAHTFNQCLAERGQLEPDANGVMNRYEFGPQHVGDLQRALAAQLAPLSKRLERGDIDGARRAALDAWGPLERCIREKWQAYFILTFQDLSVEIRANRDRKRHRSGRIDIAAAEAVAARPPAQLHLSDFDAPANWGRSATSTLRSPWLALLALLTMAAVGGWLLTRNHGHAANPAAASRP
jgi:hypothetical protein